jgi:hypothetical protein
MGLFGLTEDELAEVEAAFRPTPYMGRLLLELARSKREFDNAERREGETIWLMDAAVNLLAESLGEDALLSFYGEDPPPEAPNGEHLEVLADRLSRLSYLFARVDRSAKSSLDSASEELRAIAGGDTPRLFKQCEPIKGRPINAHRLAHHQLKALAWERFLRAHGNGPAISQIAVQNAFGQPWTTIARWKTQVTRELGQARFDQAMRLADRRTPPGGMRFHSTAEAEQRLAEDGAAYRAELSRRVEAVA